MSDFKEMRLNAFLSRAGIASRRGADDLIAAGKVMLNGRIAELGNLVKSESDVVTVNGEQVFLKNEHIYYLVYKPVGYVSTVRDAHAEKVVTALVPQNERIYPVGRLDKDSEGLIILTDDGEFAYRLTHPKHEIEKKYLVTVRGRVSEDRLDLLRSGVDIGEGEVGSADVRIVEKLPDGAVLEFVLHEGKKREIRRMCAAVHFFVVRLVRTAIGELTLNGIKPGDWRVLKSDEISLFS